MKRLVYILVLILVSFGLKAQTLPSGIPSPNSPSGYSLVGYVRSGKAFVWTKTDTTFTATYPSVVWSPDGNFYKTDGGAGSHWSLWISSTPTFGTVTSVATDNGTGITGGTITSSGTLVNDTTLLSTRLWRQKGIDSLIGLINLKLNISDTASMLSNRLKISDTTTMLSGYAKTGNVVPNTRTITTNAPLTGGGSLSNNLTLIADTGRANSQFVSGGSLNQVKDSLVALISSSGGGTVLSVSTTDGVGIISSVANPTSNPNISLRADTLTLSTRLHSDSIAMMKLNISDSLFNAGYTRRDHAQWMIDSLSNTISRGAGGGVIYYFNGGDSSTVSSYKSMSKSATVGTTVNFSLAGSGLLAQFVTAPGDPDATIIPSGVWRFEFDASVNTNGGTPQMYALVYYRHGSTNTLIGSTDTIPLTGGTIKSPYFTDFGMPQMSIDTSDRLVVQFYTYGTTVRIITLYTQDNNLAFVNTTFSAGISSLNNLTANSQLFAVDTTASGFSISSVAQTHTFKFPPLLKIKDTASMLSGYTRVNRFLDTTSTLRTLINTKGTGSLTSVGLTLPSFIGVTNSPLTGAGGTIVGTLANQTANTVFSGPTTGSAAQPTFRALVAADIPDLSSLYQPLENQRLSTTNNVVFRSITSYLTPTEGSIYFGNNLDSLRSISGVLTYDGKSIINSNDTTGKWIKNQYGITLGLQPAKIGATDTVRSGTVLIADSSLRANSASFGDTTLPDYTATKPYFNVANKGNGRIDEFFGAGVSGLNNEGAIILNHITDFNGITRKAAVFSTRLGHRNSTTQSYITDIHTTSVTNGVGSDGTFFTYEPGYGAEIFPDSHVDSSYVPGIPKQLFIKGTLLVNDSTEIRNMLTGASSDSLLVTNNGLVKRIQSSSLGFVKYTDTSSMLSPYRRITTLITNSDLTNSTISGVSLGSNLNTLTIGTHLTGTSYNGSSPVTISTDATSSNTASTIMSRDVSGNTIATSFTSSKNGAGFVSKRATAATGINYFDYQDETGTEMGYTGFATSSDNNFTIKNLIGDVLIPNNTIVTKLVSNSGANNGIDAIQSGGGSILGNLYRSEGKIQASSTTIDATASVWNDNTNGSTVTYTLPTTSSLQGGNFMFLKSGTGTLTLSGTIIDKTGTAQTSIAVTSASGLIKFWFNGTTWYQVN